MTFKSIARLLFLLFITAVVVSSQEYPPPPPPPVDDQTLGSLGVQVITDFLTGDFVKRKIQLLFDVLDLKARLLYVITSFCTTENLIALRRFLDWVCRLSTFLNQFLPEMPDINPKTALLELLINKVTNFVTPPTEAPAVYVPPMVENTPPPSVYTPSSYYNQNQDSNDINNNNNPEESNPELSVNVKRSLDPMEVAESKQKETKLTDLNEDEIRKMLKNQEGVSKLSKLIYSTKR
ncbi:uncharacterized protein LOC123674593 [Harmonia axyridis]|uniref:uncharacterized protein LOC123674593 n=1 Tax=Harmonia axyridis TaxID=115357 RepID=UPI001E277521|nr:uncharacterized protein LOC123674593 [Harmonia axyridis]